MSRRRTDKALQAMAHPIARAANRARMERWLTRHVEAIEALATGDDCAHLLPGMLDELAIAARTMVGWDDPDNIGDVILVAVDAIQAMANSGGRWDAAHTAAVKDALQCAVQVNCRMPITSVANAALWARKLSLAAKVAG